MGYRNAQEIFPEGLLKQIQRYVSGETIYIPAREERKAWGESSGYQHYILERNEEIRAGYASGLSMEELMDQYALSYDSIKMDSTFISECYIQFSVQHVLCQHGID